MAPCRDATAADHRGKQNPLGEPGVAGVCWMPIHPSICPSTPSFPVFGNVVLFFSPLQWG